MLVRMTHRGACGCEVNTGACHAAGSGAACLHASPCSPTLPAARPAPKQPVCSAHAPAFDQHKGGIQSSAVGDGAGILVAIPHLFFSEVAEKECGIHLPPPVSCCSLRQGAGGAPRG